MEKSVLLVLLFLQVSLLITAFTSADAAALETDPQGPPDLVVRRNDRNREVFGNRRKRYCDWRPGACGFAASMPESQGIPGTATRRPPPDPTGPSPEEWFKYMNGRDGQRAIWRRNR